MAMRNILCALLGALFVSGSISLPAFADGSQLDKPQSIPLEGVCLFSPSATNATFKPPLSNTVTTTTVKINATGSCTGNGAPSTMYLTLSASGPWSCAGGSGLGAAAVSWSTGSPPGSNSVNAAVTGTTDSIHVQLNGPGAFVAHGSFAYYPVGQTSCFTSGLAATDLDGALVFVSA